MFGRKKKPQPKSYLRCPYCGDAPIIVSDKCTYHNPRHTVYRYECVFCGWIPCRQRNCVITPSQRRTSTSLRGRLMMISQYDKDMCCLYIAEGMNYIWQQRENQELSRILESLADRKLMKRVHGGYAITLKGLLAVKVWRLHLFLFHHGEYKYFRRKK